MTIFNHMRRGGGVFVCCQCEVMDIDYAANFRTKERNVSLFVARVGFVRSDV